jgi:hypothetical protein
LAGIVQYVPGEYMKEYMKNYISPDFPMFSTKTN